MHHKKLISIIVPAFNEGNVLYTCHNRLVDVFDNIDNYNYEIIFVNDGSTDETSLVINNICLSNPLTVGINLSRNFGKEIAMTAGLDASKGDAVIILDADLQDPPEMIPTFITAWEDGFDIVYGKRISREGESWVKKITAKIFYKVIRKISNVNIPADTGDFRLMSRRSVNELIRLREHHRFMKGMFAWIGFPSKAIQYNRNPRESGISKFNYWKLWNFAIEGFSSFSTAPLKLATYIGLVIAAASFMAGLWFLIKTLTYGEEIKGFPTLIITILFIGGTQITFIGILGEYLGRIFGEVKNRPLYIVQDIIRNSSVESKETN